MRLWIPRMNRALTSRSGIARRLSAAKKSRGRPTVCVNFLVARARVRVYSKKVGRVLTQNLIRQQPAITRTVRFNPFFCGLEKVWKLIAAVALITHDRDFSRARSLRVIS